MGSLNRPFIPKTYHSAAGWCSLVIPGLGQILLGRLWRGVLILLTTPILAYITAWALDRQKIGLLEVASLVTSWLWIPFLLFWLWNVADARRLVSGRGTNALVGVLFAAVILYVVAWNVTNVKLDRLVTRINDARLVITDIVNPDLVTININGVDKICAWECFSTRISDTLDGKTPEGTLRASDNLLDILGRVKELPAPRWQVKMGLSEEGSRFDQFEAGKLIETIAMGLMATLFSTVLAIPVSFLAAHNVMSRVPVVGSIIYYVMRTILNVVRAVDTIVWGLIIIVWVGLGPFSGMIALTIHSVAALGKLFSEEIEHIDPGPVEAVTASGANLVQVIRYAILPQIIPPFLGFTLLRWDINMRSATVVGFVAGGGIGFFVVETIRMGGYPQYGAALWAVAVVIIAVDYISARWRESILSEKVAQIGLVKHGRLNTLKKFVYILLGLVVFIYCWMITKIDLIALFEPAPTFWRLVGDFLNVDLSPAVLDKVAQEMLVTIFQALLATTLGAILALPFSFLAARNLTGHSKTTAWLYYLVRFMFNVLRSIEALLYVAIFVFWVGIGAFPGMLALAVTSFALIGKLFSEAIENIDPGPIEAIAATGANTFQVVYYAILPQIVPPFVSYLIYQWDINIRMATIIGFAGGGGIGLTLSTYFGMLQYHKAGTVVLFIVVVVALMDFTSAKLRERLV
jgi:phosphonate transport system permease protein